MSIPTMMNDVTDFTSKLVGFASINPPGDELEILQYLNGLLTEVGFETELVFFGERRGNLIARYGPQDDPICLSGHVDVVPLGLKDWSQSPFEPKVVDGKLYGRGTTDMKGGVAAMLIAASRLIANGEALKRGILVVITGGEETGCDGVQALMDRSDLKAGMLLIPEPSSNIPLVGHKGAFWIRLMASGKTAHGSMPEQGDNAAYKLVDAISRLKAAQVPGGVHEVFGPTTMNLGRMNAGLNINSVPDQAWADLDFRTTPNTPHEELLHWVKSHLEDLDISIEIIVDLNPVYTNPDDHQVTRLLQRLHLEGVDHDPGTVMFFTDGALLKPLLGNCPFVVLGPGEPHLAHQTDEYCFVERLEQAVGLYEQLLLDYCQDRQIS